MINKIKDYWKDKHVKFFTYLTLSCVSLIVIIVKVL
jgi:hypothetical protein